MYDPSQLYIDPILTGFSVGYQDQSLYADRLMPETPVGTKSGQYRVYDRSNWIIFPSRREPGTLANEVRGGKWSVDTFSTKQHALQAPVLDEERRELTSQGGLADPTFGGDLQLDPEIDAVALITRSLLLEREQKIANLIRNAANYAGNHTVTLTGTAQWSDQTTLVGTPLEAWQTVSDPIKDLRAASNRIFLDTGRRPNTLILPYDAAAVIDYHPRIVRRYSNFQLLNEDAFRILIGFEGSIIVVDSVYNSADNIDATESIASFWGQDVWVGIVDPQPGQKTKTFGKTFVYPQPDGSIRAVDGWRESGRKADLFRTTYEYDLKIVSATAGYLIKTAVAALP
jgi:hypothetical protein